MIRTLIFGSALAGVLALGTLSAAQDEIPSAGDSVEVSQKADALAAAKTDTENWRQLTLTVC